MWTAESRALVGDFGAGQALSDEQYALLVPRKRRLTDTLRAG
jgi:putative transposase